MGPIARFLRSASLLACCAGCLCIITGCKVAGPNSSGSGFSVADFKVTDELSGWTGQAGSYREFDPASLYEIIDGGAVPYERLGLVEGITQVLQNNTKTISVFAEDFGTADNSLAIFNDKTGSLTQKLTITPYAQTMAIGFPLLGGIAAYAHDRKYYFELNLTGYDDNESAVTDASLFLQTLIAKIR
jgi:hypothetical protein